jgi:hypothetical protein
MSLVLRRPLFATRRARTISFGVTVAAVGIAGAMLTTAAPTGMDTADAVWSGGMVAVLAFFGATSRRWTWFLPAGVAAAIAGDGLAQALAAVAIVVAFVSVVRDTRSRARGAAVVGMGTIALLRAEPIAFHGFSALLMAAVALPILVSGYAHAGRRVQARTRRCVAIGGGVIGLMLAGAVLGVISVQSDLGAGARAIDGGLAAARDADDDTAAQQLGLAARSLTSADETLSSWFVSPAKTLPIVGPNISAVGSLASQASEVAEVTSLAADNADVDSLRFVGGRLDPAAVSGMQEPLENVLGALRRMDEQVSKARSPWLVAAVTERLDRLDTQLAEAVPDAKMALQAVEVAPDLLGADGPKRYLVLFTTPVEARGRVGFPGNYAELVVNQGKLSMPRFGRVSELEQEGVPAEQRTLSGPPDYVARYSRFGVAATWRNITMSPDFAEVATVAAELYPQSGGEPINGVLAVDPQGLAAIMRYTGPVQVDGLDQPLTADNAAQFLLSDQYKQFSDTDQRVDVLEDVAHATFDRLTSADLPGPRALSKAIDPIVDGGHIQFTVVNDVKAGLSLLGFGVNGQLLTPGPRSDQILFTTANAAANKLDYYLHRSESYDVHWDPRSGEITATWKVHLENTAPASGLPNYVMGNAVGLPKGSNRSFVSLYTPYELTGARIDGQEAAVQSETELTRYVYSTFVDIPPGGSVDIELDLQGTFEGHRYSLSMPVQPFSTADQAVVSVTVEGGRPVATSDGAKVSGHTATLSTTLDRNRHLTVTAPHS